MSLLLNSGRLGRSRFSPLPLNEAERLEAERQAAARKAVVPKDTIQLNLHDR